MDVSPCSLTLLFLDVYCSRLVVPLSIIVLTDEFLVEGKPREVLYRLFSVADEPKDVGAEYLSVTGKPREVLCRHFSV